MQLPLLVLVGLLFSISSQAAPLPNPASIHPAVAGTIGGVVGSAATYATVQRNNRLRLERTYAANVARLIETRRTSNGVAAFSINKKTGEASGGYNPESGSSRWIAWEADPSEAIHDPLWAALKKTYINGGKDGEARVVEAIKEGSGVGDPNPSPWAQSRTDAMVTKLTKYCE